MIGTIRISQLPQSGPITGAENLIVNQLGDTRLTTVNQVVGILTYVSLSGISTNVIGGIASVTSLSVSGVSTLGSVQISSGIVTATTGIVTYYGDGSKLSNIISGVGIQSSGVNVGSGVTTLNFIGAGNTFSVDGSTVNISIQGGGGGGVSSQWVTTPVGIHTLSNVGIGTTNPTTKLHVSGDVNLDDGGTYTTTLQTITPTANRTLSLPDATGTIALIAGSSGQLIYNLAGAYSGVVNSGIDTLGNVTLGSRLTSSLNGAASAPPVSLTGTWFTGGSSTTTKPQLLIEPSGTTSTSWSTSGTGLGLNAASGFTGNLLDLQVNGTSRFRVNEVSSNGKITTGWALFSGILTIGGDGSSNLVMGSTRSIAWSATTNPEGGSDLFVSRDAANTLAQRNGTNAQTFRVYNTYTSSTNYELGKLEWTSNIFRIGTEKGSAGGTPRTLELQTDGTTRVAISTTGLVGIGTTIPTSTLHVVGNSIISGISTLGTVRVSSGIVTASSGIVTYYGDGSNLTRLPTEIGLACSDETTDLTTGTAKATFRMPYAMTLTSVRANVNTAPSGAAIVINIKESGTTIFSTKPQIDSGSLTSIGSTVTPVISDANLADDAEIKIDIDQVGVTTAGKGLKVWLIGTRA